MKKLITWKKKKKMKKPQELYNQIPRQTAPHHLYEQYYLGLSSKKGRVRVGERKSYQSLLYPITLPWYFPKKKIYQSNNFKRKNFT